MTTAVVASFCTAHPDKGGQVALALLATREFIQFDLMRRAKEANSRFMTGLSLDPMSSLYSEERRKSNELKHRAEHLETLAVNLQFGGRQEEVWRILDNHMDEIPDECSRTYDDRAWLLALYRMDVRRFVVSPYTPAPQNDITDDGDKLINSIGPDVNDMEADIQEIVSSNERDVREVNQIFELSGWIKQRWERDHDEDDSSFWVNALSQVRQPFPEADFARLLLGEVPPKVAAICVMDHWEEMGIEDREWCVSTLVSQLKLMPEDEDQIMPIPGIPFTGYIMLPSGFAAYVLPRILVAEPENETVLEALARALTHASEQVVFNASQGIAEFLKNRDPEFVFRCAAVIAIRARIVEPQRSYGYQPSPRASVFRRLYKITANMLRRVGERLSFLPTNHQHGAERQPRTASSLAREQFLSESINAEEQFMELDIATLNGVVAIRPILELTSRFPSSTLSRAFFKKVALAIVDGWSPPHGDQDNFSQDYRNEIDEMDSLAGFALRLESGVAIDCCQPLLDAVDKYPDKVPGL